MPESYFCGPTLDDLMRDVIEAIQRKGEWINPTQGGCTELKGVLLELENPRARLSRTETRGKPFSCLGELCWYLARSNDLEFIRYYIPAYSEWANDNVIVGGYGPRLFDWKGINQLDLVTQVLRRKRDSRQAVIQLFDACDVADDHKSIPCTCTLQFMLRNGKLHMFTSMRSNDAFIGLPHDFFAFTMIQEILTRSLSVELGSYKHSVGSLHLYDDKKDAAQQFLEEGFQSTTMSMPPMPQGDPWPAIEFLLKAEAAIRTGERFETDQLSVDPYWADLVRLLQVYRFSKDDNCDGIVEVRDNMSSSMYRLFIDQRLSECRNRLAARRTDNA